MAESSFAVFFTQVVRRRQMGGELTSLSVLGAMCAIVFNCMNLAVEVLNLP